MIDSICKRDYVVVQIGPAADRADRHGGEPHRRRALRRHQPAHPGVSDGPVHRDHHPSQPSTPTASPRLREFWHYFSMNNGAVLGLVVFVLLRARRDLRAADRAASPRRQTISALSRCRRSGTKAARPQFLLGTDAVGRDILSRLIYGARYLAVHRLRRGRPRAGQRHHPRPARRLFPRLGRRADHAPHGHHPGLPVAAAGAGAGRHPRPRPVQRHARHRAGAAAAFRAADPRGGDGGEEPRIRHPRPRWPAPAICG